jgi:hypothetical protein
MPGPNLLSNISKARALTPEIEADINELFTYKEWTPEEVQRGTDVKNALANAVKTIVKNVPAGQTRDQVVMDMIDIRMRCNAAITFNGKC